MNWKRPRAEVEALMGLLRDFLLHAVAETFQVVAGAVGQFKDVEVALDELNRMILAT